jgi:hypothetical protein
MAVFDIVAFDVAPGGMDEFLTAMRDLKSICERIDVGLTSFRLLASTIAGTTTGRMTFVAEYVNVASWSASSENEMQNAELNALIERASRLDPPYRVVSRSFLTEIDL